MSVILLVESHESPIAPPPPLASKRNVGAPQPPPEYRQNSEYKRPLAPLLAPTSLSLSASLSANTKPPVWMLLSATAAGVGGAVHTPLFYCLNSSSTTHIHPPDRKPSAGARIPFPSRPKPTQNHPPSPLLRSQPPLHPVAHADPTAEELAPSSAAALAAAIRGASPASSVEFTQRVEKRDDSRLVLPSPDFQQLCVEQLDLFRMVVEHDAILSVS